MKNLLKSLGILSLFLLVGFSLTSCSDDDDPADNVFFIGTYEGAVSYTKGLETKSNPKGTVRVVKVGGDNYNFVFSDDIPSIEGITIEKGKNTSIDLGFDEGHFIRINDKDLNISYGKDGAIWTVTAKRK